MLKVTENRNKLIPKQTFTTSPASEMMQGVELTGGEMKKESRILTELTYWLLSMVLVGAAMVACHPAYAETAIWAGAWSKHLITNDDYTSSHDMVAIEHNGVLAASYRNSYGRESYAIGYGRNVRYGDLRLSGYIGATTGYTKCWGNDDSSGNVCPMFVGAAHYTKYRVQPGVLLFGEALALTVRVELY